MKAKRLLLHLAVAAAFLVGATGASAKTEIQWWHAMGGALGEKLNAIAEGFNASQNEYQVVPVNKGNYTETMTAGIAAFRSGKPPHIMQVFEVGTASMMAAKGAIYPVYKLMADTGTPFDVNAYLPTVIGYYTTSAGELLSMPFNSSTPILYYNKEAFKKAGLPDRAPTTWPELVEFAKKTQAAGYPCGFTTAWQSWVQIENFSAWHNVPLATYANGFDSLKTEFKFNSPLHVRHIGNMAEWQKSKIFDYGGRRGSGQAKFTTGKDCAMYMQSSAGYAGIKRTSKFEFGTGMLPYYPDVKGAPQNTIIGGATLWVLQGHPKKDYVGVAKFFSYLSTKEVQADWHQFTGYLPITMAAYEYTKASGFYDKNPGTETALKQMTLHKPTANSRGLRLGNFVQIRDVINNELEAVWSGKKTAQKALDDAVSGGNKLLRQFEKAHM